MGFIYKVTNIVTGKIYIGKTTKTVEERFNSHKKESLLDNDDSYFHNALRKYGFNNFIVEQLDSAETVDELNTKEKLWISRLDAKNPLVGYNIAYGGDGGDIFHALSEGKQTIKREKHSKDTSNRMWITNGIVDKYINKNSSIPEGFVKGRKPFSEEFKRHMSESCKGRIISEATIQKRREKRLGHLVSEETREKLRKANLGKKYSDEVNKKKGRSRFGDKNPAFGVHYKWLTNGDEDIRVYEHSYEQLPSYYMQGYRDGRCNKSLFKGADK